MRVLRFCAGASLAMLLCGCLEVRQHPAWLQGEYAGKPDDLQYHRLFHNDKLAWSAAIIDRNYLQDEYRRAKP